MPCIVRFCCAGVIGCLADSSARLGDIAESGLHEARASLVRGGVEIVRDVLFAMQVLADVESMSVHCRAVPSIVKPVWEVS